MSLARNLLVILSFGLLGLATQPLTAHAKEKAEPYPEIFQKLLDCKKIAEDAARLSCLDAQLSQIDAAASRNEVVVVDRKEIQKVRKGLFGLSLPSLGLFGGGDDDQSDGARVTEIDSTIKSAQRNEFGKWTVVLQDGARWVQAEDRMMQTPKPGQTVHIKRSGLGGYFASINNQSAIKMRRIN